MNLRPIVALVCLIELMVRAPVYSEQGDHKVTKSVPAAQALGWLKNGNTRYRTGKLRADGAGESDRKRLSTGQHPHTIVLSCSDSRVPPEVVFDQKLGEIFVVRTAGQGLDYAAIASIEYAIEHLGAQLIVVMGHTQCGAVKAALAAAGGKDAGSPSLNALVRDLQPRLTEFQSTSPSAEYAAEGWENAAGVARDLVDRSSLVAERMKGGALKVVPALYHLQTGVVIWDRPKFAGQSQ